MHLEALNTDRKEQHGQDSRKDLRYDFARQTPHLFLIMLYMSTGAASSFRPALRIQHTSEFKQTRAG